LTDELTKISKTESSVLPTSEAGLARKKSSGEILTHRPLFRLK
jgi:hypothetical protein